MIRLTPSLITIGLGDIRDYDRRAKRRAKLQPGNIPQATPHSQIILPIRSISPRTRAHGPSANAIPSTDGSHFANQTNQKPDEAYKFPRLESPLPLECVLQIPAHAQGFDIFDWTNPSPRSSDGTITNNHSVDYSSVLIASDKLHNAKNTETFEEWLDARRGRIMDEMQDAQSSQESAELEAGEESFENLGTRRLSSPSKDNFDYGGFVESPSQQESDQSRGSSPFEPEDSSTTPHLQPPAAQRLQARTRLPRSPLFLAQNASSSPELRSTASLTPRVVSRVATHNTPDFMFTQPARRPGPSPHPHSTRQPRTLRHQANSFSFDDSERSSVAYEQERALSSSTTDSRPRPSESLNLRQELRGSSLQSSRIPSFASSIRSQEHPSSDREVSAQSNETENESNPDRLIRDEEMDVHSLVLIPERSVISTTSSFNRSQELRLPPPFSTVSRSVSRAESLPSSSPGGNQSGPSPASIIRSFQGSPSVSPSRDISISSSIISQLIREHDERQASSPPSGGRRRLNPIVRAAARLFSSPISRSPSRKSPPPSPSPSPRRRTRPQPPRRRGSDTGPRTYTPSRGYSVYNDSLPAASQPQTPAHLPEARHQSQYHPSYTAPTTRSMARLRDHIAEPLVATLGRPSDPFDRDSAQRWMHEPDARWIRQRSGSPAGMSDDGFQGLYGGRENGDDEQSWIDGVRARNAEMRMWQTRSSDGRLEDEE
ncbi:924dc92a-1eb8-4d01-8c1e-e29f19ad166e [Sclerotinia trifoliorum]|uniref:924dc92a-1eb8-4d01-8c1e-e29f19ad166e n=1 Tax=Sclerotinia trifoliorum TaxID=28548 RepID=A0A8H2W3Z2_9HELO|nr:924dc92a-1eb8-4d01-8c1e-e29f19ad166e [Sclerotinia trifoliorum]